MWFILSPTGEGIPEKIREMPKKLRSERHTSAQLDATGLIAPLPPRLPARLGLVRVCRTYGPQRWAESLDKSNLLLGRRMQDENADIIRLMHKSGVGLLAGTDTTQPY